MKNWKITGYIATVIIMLSVPAYLIIDNLTDHGKQLAEERAQFVGSSKCIECHKKEYDEWRISDHFMAMAKSNDSTVLGDFNNSTFEHKGLISRFYKKDDKFFVHTEGEEKKMGDYEIPYTFGVRPLQQYLIPLDRGRYQCLPIPWDSDKNRWYHLVQAVYDDEDIPADDWLYWTNGGQNWNGMCAECHSTNLQKNYDLKTKSYHTTWSEINVSCEACHGPASKHLDWAKLPEMARPQNTNTALIVRSQPELAEDYIKQCVRCHSRRSYFGNFTHSSDDLLDYMIPQLPIAPNYHVDGQILEEDYVYTSFVQSKMYDNDVKCNDCHNVHSGKLVKEGNALCLQCHRIDQYDNYAHHFHKKKDEKGQPLILDKGKRVVEVGEGAECINCHMPAQYYMGIDYRNDHSIRIPRPDISIKINTPNACNQCHTDKSAQWALDYTKKWYGESFEKRPHYGLVFSAAQQGKVEAEEGLINIVRDEVFLPIVRAAAVSYLPAFITPKSIETITYALHSPESIIRHTAVQSYPDNDRQRFISELTPLLFDLTRAVRMTAAIRLSVMPKNELPSKYHKAFDKSLEEYKLAMEYTADFQTSRHNLGNMYSNLNNLKKAKENYLAAIEIDSRFQPPKINLAMIYNREGENDKAMALFQDIIKTDPGFSEAYYYYGLLLAEQKNFTEAAKMLNKAAKFFPQRARIFYNLGLVQQYLNNSKEAEKALLQTVKIEPQNGDNLYALIDFYLKNKQFAKAEKYALKMKTLAPENAEVEKLIKYIQSLKR
ncbi:tetratricopeptide repeat protein [bacterium]|nr:tetratricopeptide repeat protein [bacterium]